jgi:hypothetical protein
MRARQLLPAALALAGLVVLSACGSGDGLRVEGVEAAPSSATPSGATKGFGPAATPSAGPTPKATVAVSLPAVRKALLADKQLDTQSRAALTDCTVIDRCLSLGATVDAMHTGRPQVVVLIHTVDKFRFGGFLIAVEPSGPRRVWSFKGQQLRIIPATNGDLVVESELFGPNDKPCCASGKLVEVYRWDGRQMAKLSSKDQKGD